MFKREAKWSLWGHFPAPGPTRKLRDEATSFLGELLCNLLPSFSYK